MASFLDLASKAVKRISRSARIESFSDASLMKEYLRQEEVGGGRRKQESIGQDRGRCFRIEASDTSSSRIHGCGRRSALLLRPLAPPSPTPSLDAVADQILDARVAHVGVAVGQLHIFVADATAKDAGIVAAQNGGNAGLEVERVGVCILPEGGGRGEGYRVYFSGTHTHSPSKALIHIQMLQFQ